MTLKEAIEIQERFGDGGPVLPSDLSESTNVVIENAVEMYHALEFYANKRNYISQYNVEEEDYVSAVEGDRGKRAGKVIAKEDFEWLAY